MDTRIEDVVNQPYRHGFKTEVESDVFAKGINEDVVRLISKKKQEPDWLLEFRLN